MQARPLKISIETDYAMYLHQQNYQNVYNYVSATLNEAAIIFANEDISIQLSEIVAWNTADNYDENFTSTTLQQFGSRRKNDFNGDLVHLLTSEKRDIGGLANVNVLGTCYTFYPDQDFNRGPYGLSVVDYWPCAFGLFHYDVWTFAHEIGHNLGSRHTHANKWVANNGEMDQPFDNAYNTQTGFYCDDSRSNTTCSDIEISNTGLVETGGTIMSYFVANSIGVSLYRGFGDQPGDLIRSRSYVHLANGCTDQIACNYEPDATVNDASCFYGQSDSDASVFEDFRWLKGKVDFKSCDNESIVVYQNSEGTVGVSFTQGNCIEYYNCRGNRLFPLEEEVEILKSWTCRDCVGNMRGCTSAAACNYNPQAVVDDGTCNFGDSTCPDACDDTCMCLDLGSVLNTSDDVFLRYPWLADSINYPVNYTFDKITEYDFIGFQFIKIDFKNGTVALYLSNGTKYCGTNSCANCLDVIDAEGADSITCWIIAENCDAKGVVRYQICDEGQWYYLIETTDGEILDPYNDAFNINFDYPDGAVVNFSYQDEFPSNCEYAVKGVQINCIEEVATPCNNENNSYSNTGTVFYDTCGNGWEYYLIEMSNGQILDPYNSSAVNFNYVAGDVVEFEYVPYNQTYCNLSDEAGMITCIRSVSCNNLGNVFLQNCNGNNYLIQTTNGTIIYPNDQSGSNFNFQNGDVVQFGYSGTFITPCAEADYGVNISCIQSVDLPCTNTGTVFSDSCENTIYTLIDMSSDGILDPYLNAGVNFQFVEGDFVEFAYMPFSFSACSAALQSGIVTCIKSTCRNNVRIINSVPIPNGVNDNAKHIITYGEVHQFSDVILKAPRITLEVGFKVKAGAKFKTISNGCN